MRTHFKRASIIFLIITCIQLFFASNLSAQSKISGSGTPLLFIFLLVILLILLGISIFILVRTGGIISESKEKKSASEEENLSNYLQTLDSREIEIVLKK